jgi:hypothetical protein
MSDRKNRFALIGRFEKRCKENSIPLPMLNKHKEQWAADDLLESFDDIDLHEAMDYYFSINNRPTWKGYCTNVERLILSLRSKREDQVFRQEMRQKAKEWLSESRG